MKKILTILSIFLLSMGGLQAQESELAAAVQTTPAIAQPTLETQVFNLINQHRATNLLAPLVWSSAAAQQARNHSLNMASGLVPFSHQGSDLRYAALRQAIPSLTRFGENVAYNYGSSNPVATAVNGWLQSRGHFANIMGDYNFTGVGVAKNAKGEYYFTQIFVKASSAISLQNTFEIESDEENAVESVEEEPIQIEVE